MDFGIVAHSRLSSEDYAALCDGIGTVIVPSVWEEPLPYVVTEAMLSGKLLIASRIGGIPEQVANCEGVFLFDPGEDEQLAEKVLCVENLNRENADDLGAKNRERVLRKFNNKKTLADFVRLMTRVLG
jgi:glycosyltransferase involved in cell wall biosynthesis